MKTITSFIVLRPDGSQVNVAAHRRADGRFESADGKPLYNKARLEELGLLEEAEQQDGRRLFADSRFHDAILKEGDNVCGYRVLDKSEAYRSGHMPLEIFGSRIYGRIPSDDWHHVKSKGWCWYMSKERLEDEDEFDAEPGWEYRIDAFNYLASRGYRFRAFGVDLDMSDWKASYDAAADSYRAEAKRKMEEAERRQKRVRGAQSVIISARENAYMPKERDPALEADIGGGAEIAFGEGYGPVEHITFRMSGPSWSGRNLYGSGSYLVLTDKYLYDVYQNSHDGDCWANSNSSRGIVRRIDRSKEIDDALRVLLTEHGMKTDLLDGTAQGNTSD